METYRINTLGCVEVWLATMIPFHSSFTRVHTFSVTLLIFILQFPFYSARTGIKVIWLLIGLHYFSFYYIEIKVNFLE